MGIDFDKIKKQASEKMGLICVSIEKGKLADIDDIAKKLEISKSAFARAAISDAIAQFNTQQKGTD